MEKKIKTFEQLIKFIEETDLNGRQYAEIIRNTLFVFVAPDRPKSELIKDLRQFWSEWGEIPRRNWPLYIDDKN